MWDCKCKKNYLNTTYLCIIIKKNHQITSYFLHLTSYFILPTCRRQSIVTRTSTINLFHPCCQQGGRVSLLPYLKGVLNQGGALSLPVAMFVKRLRRA